MPAEAETIEFSSPSDQQLDFETFSPEETEETESSHEQETREQQYETTDMFESDLLVSAPLEPGVHAIVEAGLGGNPDDWQKMGEHQGEWVTDGVRIFNPETGNSYSETDEQDRETAALMEQEAARQFAQGREDDRYLLPTATERTDDGVIIHSLQLVLGKERPDGTREVGWEWHQQEIKDPKEDEGSNVLDHWSNTETYSAMWTEDSNEEATPDPEPMLELVLAAEHAEVVADEEKVDATETVVLDPAILEVVEQVPVHEEQPADVDEAAPQAAIDDAEQAPPVVTIETLVQELLAFEPLDAVDLSSESPTPPEEVPEIVAANEAVEESIAAEARASVEPSVVPVVGTVKEMISPESANRDIGHIEAVREIKTPLIEDVQKVEDIQEEATPSSSATAENEPVAQTEPELTSIETSAMRDPEIRSAQHEVSEIREEPQDISASQEMISSAETVSIGAHEETLIEEIVIEPLSHSTAVESEVALPSEASHEHTQEQQEPLATEKPQTEAMVIREYAVPEPVIISAGIETVPTARNEKKEFDEQVAIAATHPRQHEQARVFTVETFRRMSSRGMPSPISIQSRSSKNSGRLQRDGITLEMAA